MKPTPRQRELSKLKKLLSVRERQLHLAVATLKGIVEFQSATHSVFVSEVRCLQLSALAGLRAMENLQRKKPLVAMPEDQSQHDKHRDTMTRLMRHGVKR